MHVFQKFPYKLISPPFLPYAVIISLDSMEDKIMSIA